MSKQLFIDGDGCRQDTRELAERLGSRGVRVIIVANRELPHAEMVQMVVCPQQENAADEYILAHMKAGDLLISRDLRLVELTLKKYDGEDSCFAISDSGEIYEREQMAERIMRAETAKIRRNTRAWHFSLQEMVSSRSRTDGRGSTVHKNSHEHVANFLERWRVSRQ